MKYLKYKMTSNETSGLKREFTNKAEALSAARTQVKAGWSAKVTDMTTKTVIFDK
ncbi:hypothetical protein QEH52_01760 [Coraliomargarita sp. SDUM461003]|uniref:Uncharacterized protein n=1 Tax=Thalassobacterium maritimum TaxID=3041265 RepID=A0ABU1AQ04_9BACT|nr:hypothetical protein [Coraliomargarita sp. SDUM461003]MDQ8206218.1 hypothetical protein [Coraliomargarita sp. SDUM461003]